MYLFQPDANHRTLKENTMQMPKKLTQQNQPFSFLTGSASAATPRLEFRLTCSFFSEPSKISPSTPNPQIQSVVRRLSSPSRIETGASAKRDSAFGGTGDGKAVAAAAKAVTVSNPCIDPVERAGNLFGMPLEGGNA